MEKRVIGFIPPVMGVDSSFNTFRLGVKQSKVLNIGEEVFLLNEKEKLIFGTAVIEALDVGDLGDMCLIYGHKNHTQLAEPPENAPARLFKVIQRIYGPHIASVAKKTTVISLKRLE